MPDANTELMTRIQAQHGAEIADACKSSSVPEAFLAALIANESGGDPNAKRFERNVLASLWEVLEGHKAAYGSLGAQDLRVHILPGETTATVGGFAAQLDSALNRLDELATSWGLTQIMGYETIVFGVPIGGLVAPPSSLRISLRMLAFFGSGAGVDLTKGFAELFDCWNTGRPHRPTADPQYIPNGLARMQIYQALAPLPGATGPEVEKG